MDLAVILPLAVLFVLQVLISLLLLAPRALSKHAASLLALTRTNTVCSTVLHTTAVAVLAITASSLIQLLGITKSMAGPQFGDRVMALTIEELRALLAVVLGTSNLALLFTNRALGAEQQKVDKTTINLQAMQKQAMGLQTEYMRATQDSSKGSSGGGDTAGSRSEISKLIAEKQKLLEALDEAKAEAAGAAKNLSAVKAQAQGLEREYDRLLSENDGLKRRLARHDGQFASADKKRE